MTRGGGLRGVDGDYDPQGTFLRRFVPELARVPAAFLVEPHLIPVSMQTEAGWRIGRNYPAPVVDHAAAYRQARERMGTIRRTEHARREAQRVYACHGSRERPLSGRPEVTRPRRPRPTPEPDVVDQGQGELGLCEAEPA